MYPNAWKNSKEISKSLKNSIEPILKKDSITKSKHIDYKPLSKEKYSKKLCRRLKNLKKESLFKKN